MGASTATHRPVPVLAPSRPCVNDRPDAVHIPQPRVQGAVVAALVSAEHAAALGKRGIAAEQGL